jgi:phosphoglycolate phosphatase-like HAD superfamily hydrolase
LDLGLRQWVRSAATALRIKTDGFTSLEWQKAFLLNLHSSDATRLADVLRQSLEDLRLHAAGDVDEVARGMIEAFVTALNVSPVSGRVLEKLKLHLGLKLSAKRVLEYPDLLNQLNDHAKALVAIGPLDLIQSSLEHLDLERHFQFIRISSTTGPEHDPYDLNAAIEDWNIVAENLFVVWTGQWYRLPSQIRRG